MRIGPLPASSARAWVPYASSVLEALASGAVDVGLPLDDDVVEAFRRYLAEWDALAQRNGDFEWETLADRDLVARLSTAWLELMTKLSGRVAELGLHEGPPAGEVFYHALVKSIGDALAADDDPLGEKLQEVWPAIGEIVPRAAADEPRRIRVVVADDARDLRLVVRLALEQDGRFEVVGEAADGNEVVDVCERERPDVVLLDLVMPRVDGWTALERLREACPEASVVVMSTIDEAVAADRALASGAAAYVQKSVSLVDLTETLAALAA